MNKLENISEVLEALKNHEILTINKEDFYILKNNKICCYKKGTSFMLMIDDFIDLYKTKTFFIYENENVFIDDDKDENYYRYYRK